MQDDDDNEPNAENDNLENLQKVYSGKMRSVEYTIHQGETIEGTTRSSCHGQFGGASGCSGAPEGAPTRVRVCAPGEPNMYVTSPGEAMAAQSSKDAVTVSPPSEQYVGRPDHFNLDQLLDFASSFHYDRRKALKDEEPSVTVTLPSDEERANSPSDEANSGHEESGSSPKTPKYSTVRRRSSAIFDKIKTTSSSGPIVKELKQVSICKDANKSTITFSQPPEVTSQTTTVTYSRSSYYFAGSLDGSTRSQSLGTGLNAAASASRSPPSPVGPLYSSSSASNIPAGGTSTSVEAGLPLVSVFPQRPAPIVRLNSIEPNTVMVSVSDMPQLWDITTQEIIDELERQVAPALTDIRGVRVAGRAAYISLGRHEPLQQLLGCGLTIRGTLVPLIDITRESIVVALTGVPHYIADATLSILLSAFGTIIGEIERRFYKGVDTGERFVRMKLKKHVKLPKYVTVGGCRIVLGIQGSDRNPALNEWGHIGSHSSGPSSTPQVTAPHGPPPPPPHGPAPHGPSPRGPSPPHGPPPPPTHESRNDFPPPPSPDPGQCSEPSSSERSCDKSDVSLLNLNPTNIRNDNLHFHSHTEKKDIVSKERKTFSSRCVVNLKLPERPSSTGNIPRGAHREAPLPPCIPGPTSSSSGPPTSMGAGHVLRAGSLGKSTHSREAPPPPTVLPPPGTSPAVGRRTRRGSTPLEPRPAPDVPIRQRPSSVVFEEQPSRDAPIRLPPPPPPQIPPILPTPLANGILRKPSVSEQEALLPGQTKTHQGPTATIRNRLKLGRSVSYDSGKKQAEKDKRKLSTMESISENTINEDISDITPLGTTTGNRRDSEKSTVSTNSKASSNKPKKEVIDLPWCGCWGNGCF